MDKNTGNIVGFCGAGGTGKTTTAKAVVYELQRLGYPYELLPSASREVFKRHKVNAEASQLDMPLDQRWRLQRDIQMAHWENYTQNFRNKLLVSDRTQLDQMSYAYLWCSPVLDEDNLALLDTLVQSSLLHYRAIFYFPLTEFDAHSDGMRTDSPGLRNHFDLLLRGILEAYDVGYIKVPIASVEARMHYIVNWMEVKGII